MCGIIGSFGSCIQESWVRDQLPSICHRGPDHQESILLSPLLAVGATRLAMIDKHPRSNQPFIFRDQKVGIVFNGEIYNHNALRKEMSESGVIFDTSSDTEVLLKVLINYGIKGISKLQGMYSFAFFDYASNELVLCRDGLGKKPLYYSVEKNTINWSSSFKSLTRLHSTEVSDLSRSATVQFLSLGYLLDPHTMHQKIFSLMPGTHKIISITPGGLAIEDRKNDAYLCNGVELKSSLRNLVTEAVDSRVEGQKTLAVSMSGGVDSSIIGFLANQANQNVVAYSAAWSDSDKDRYNTDANAAEDICRNLKIEFRKINMFRSDELHAELIQFVQAMEEPNNNPSGLSMNYLYKAISGDGHRLVLTGDGADEFLGGYPRYEKVRNIPRFLPIPSDKVACRLRKFQNQKAHKLATFISTQSTSKSYEYWLTWHRVFEYSEIDAMLVDISKGESRKIVTKALGALLIGKNPWNQVARLMKADQNVWLSMESNRKLDRISMRQSIEARSPFQDEKVIQKATLLMSSSRFRIVNKKFLRSEFRDVINAGVRDDKAGFISPVGHWLRNNPVIVEESLRHLETTNLFEKNVLSLLRDAPMKGNFKEIMKLWSLIVFSYWIRYEYLS